VRERPYTSASNRARRISEGRSVAKVKWEADKCSKHFSYRLKGKAGTKRPIPMTSVKSLPARFYRLKSGYAPTGVYLNDSATEMTTNAGGVKGQCPRRGGTSSATAAGGETSRKCSGKRWER